MNSVDFKESNAIMGSGGNPNTLDAKICRALCPESDGSFTPEIVLQFEMTESEKVEFAKTGKIYLAVMGKNMSPVTMMVFNPFEHFNYIPIDKIKDN